MKQVGRYRVVEEIGRGATGIVYKAADSRTNRTVAIKQIRSLPGQKIDTAGLETVRALSAISHPHIATFYEAVQADGQIFAVYEYVAGASLETLLRRMALPEKPVLLRCFEQAAQALDYADTKGFVHRDIKPSNILLTGNTSRQFTAKITDFGVSQIAPHEMTAGGSMVGTPFYLSPEEIQGTAVDGRSDQFSLAVVIYEVLTGAKPFTADNLQGIFYQICKQPAKQVNEINPALTEAVGDIVDRALAKNASQRFFSCTEFVDALAGALREIPEWAAAVGEFASESSVPVGIPIGTTAASLAAGEGFKRLPSLRRRVPGDEEEWDVERRKHSPLMLLAWMLALSAVAIAITALWGEWNWHSLLPSQKPAQSTAATQATNNNAPPQTTNNSPAQASGNPPAQEKSSKPLKPEEQTQTQAQTAPPPTNANPPNTTPPNTNPSASAPPATAQEAAPTPAKNPTPVQPRESGPVPGATASIDLLSVPPGATMVVDGNQSTSCVAPCTMSLPNGRHTVAAELNGYNVGRRVFNVPEDSSLVTALNRSTGTLVVTSTPPGSRIFIDGKLFGETPATLHLSAGRHKLVLINGRMQHEETVEIDGGQLESRSVRW